MSKSYYHQIALAPLGPEATRADAAAICSAPIPRSTGSRTSIRERTAGNPFFIEEVVRSLVEAGKPRGRARRLPAGRGRSSRRRCRPACRPSSSARIDRLRRAREGGAAGGRGDRKGVLGPRARARRRAWSRRRSRQTLRELVAGEFVFEQELYPEAVYAFTHPLTQEVAYGSQLGERRVRGSRGGRPGDRRAAPGAAGRAGRAAGPALGERRGDARGGALERARRRLGRDQGPDRVAARTGGRCAS